MTAKPMLTLARPHSVSNEIKRSRFKARAGRVDSPDEALAKLAGWTEAEATHNCWAYKIGELYRFSDDGEPGGSAGRPILAAIEGQGLDHVLVVVTRFFGGVKLGVGGLVRAYGGTAAECLRTGERLEVRPTLRLDVRVPFDCVSSLFPLLEEFRVEKREETFVEEGLHLVVDIDAADTGAFRERLANACRGQSQVVAAEKVP